MRHNGSLSGARSARDRVPRRTDANQVFLVSIFVFISFACDKLFWRHLPLFLNRVCSDVITPLNPQNDPLMLSTLFMQTIYYLYLKCCRSRYSSFICSQRKYLANFLRSRFPGSIPGQLFLFSHLFAYRQDVSNLLHK